MVLATQISAPLTDVIVAAARSYARTGDTVVETTFAEFADAPGVPGRAVVATDTGVVECVLDDGVRPGDLAAGLSRLVAAGWSVVTLVPLGRLGEAHRALRGSAARLQPWWLDDRYGVCFGAPEVA